MLNNRGPTDLRHSWLYVNVHMAVATTWWQCIPMTGPAEQETWPISAEITNQNSDNDSQQQPVSRVYFRDRDAAAAPYI